MSEPIINDRAMSALKLFKEMNNIGDAAADVHGLDKWIVFLVVNRAGA